ncbi:MAG TPA: hypothetical protein EYP53_06595 [Candidatus Latescibacteria bacterium]|nr:hypothetical protein [Candidatus Latescibacterota bacterium]
MILPQVRVGAHKVSRLIVGGNPFSGHSHRSPELNREMRDYYTVSRIKETLRRCERSGITAIVARGDNFIMRVLNEYWNEGGKLQWIAQTASERASIEANISQIASFGPIACYHHGTHTDALYREGRVDKVKDYLALIRDLGMAVGLGTHNPEVIRYAENKGFDLDFYMMSFYDIYSRGGEIYLEEDRKAACGVIRQTDKPVIAFKILAAGRNNPEEAFKYAFENIKPIDAVVVGVFTKYHANQIEEDVQLTNRFAGAT